MGLREATLSRAVHGALVWSRHIQRSSGLDASCEKPLRWIQHRRISSPETQESAEKHGPLHRYQEMVQQGLLQHDAQQEVVGQMLDKLLGQMKHYQKEMEGYQVILKMWTEERERHKATILKEESEMEARRRLQRMAEENRSTVWGWWTRKTRHARAEPGAGRIVARIKREKQLDSLVGPRPPLPPSPQGLYLYGNVGCGKTFLMDLFFHSSAGFVKHRRRMHFHAAMLEVHDRLHRLWKERREKWEDLDDAKSNSNSPYGMKRLTLEAAAKEWLAEEEYWEKEQETNLSILYAVADNLFGEGANDGGGASLLCFDEVQVVDVFTALALSAILSRLLSNGTVIVTTSNRAPQDLNKDGLQKQIFSAFIAKLEEHCQAVLVGVDKDYRRVIASMHNAKEEQLHYFWPLGDQSQEKLNQHWNELVLSSDQNVTITSSISVMFGRVLEVPQSCRGVARFSFEELCSRPLGAADYVSIAQNYHTVFITDIPVMSMRNSDQARRFITLVDELYNHHCRLVCTTAAPVEELFLGTDDGPLVDLESLQFETEAESSRLRRDVLVSGNVAPLGATSEAKSSIESLLSGREELFAFRRAVSRLIEMESPIYLQALSCHPKFVNT
ncbi:unnamed protein product [Calypogeia fissa]